MTFKLEFKTGNSAFGNDPTVEISRILGFIAGHVKNGNTEAVIRDVNGNVIGKYELIED